MVPWAGRVRHGRFSVRRRRPSVADQLRRRTRSMEPGSSSHGKWSIEMRDSCALTCRLAMGVGRPSRSAIRAVRRLADVHPDCSCRRQSDARLDRLASVVREARDEPICGSRGCTCAMTITSRTAARSRRHLLHRGTTASPGLWARHGCGLADWRCRSTAIATTGSSTTCLLTPHASEPQTATPDAFNLGGAARLEPGEEFVPQHDDHLGVTGGTPRCNPVTPTGR